MNPSVMSATIGQLLRSGQRDEQYLNELNNEFNQIIQYWFGIRRWLKIRQFLPQMSQLLYYSMTTLSGLQTLGEEYVNIVQIDGNKLAVPTIIKRVVAIFLQIFSPYLLSTVLRSLERRLENQEKWMPSWVESRQRREQLLKLIPIIEQSFQFIHKFHLVFFYLNGNYYNLSKRVADIRYISMNTSITDGSGSRTRFIYQMLGYLSLSQLCIALIIRFNSIQNSVFNSSNANSGGDKREVCLKSKEVELINRCSLCLEERNNSCVSPCGHLFCWFCIHEWLQMKSECPLCREPLQSSRIVLLQNYP